MSLQDTVTSTTRFMREVRLELRKVSWPKREEVVRATITTLVASTLLVLFLALTDVILERGIRPLFTGDIATWTVIMLVYFGVMLYLVYLIIKE